MFVCVADTKSWASTVLVILLKRFRMKRSAAATLNSYFRYAGTCNHRSSTFVIHDQARKHFYWLCLYALMNSDLVAAPTTNCCTYVQWFSFAPTVCMLSFHSVNITMVTVSCVRTALYTRTFFTHIALK